MRNVRTPNSPRSGFASALDSEREKHLKTMRLVFERLSPVFDAVWTCVSYCTPDDPAVDCVPSQSSLSCWEVFTSANIFLFTLETIKCPSSLLQWLAHSLCRILPS